MLKNFVEIDGSYLEGGGQILRTATALSAITGKPCHIFKIRAGRKNPGLQNQHLYGLVALAKLYQADLQGAELHSQEIWFSPKKILPQILEIKIPTAGAITLVLQNLILPASLAEQSIIIKFFGGATETHFAPTLIYTEKVLLPILQKMGFNFEIKVFRRGYYPEGGVQIEAKIFPYQLDKNSRPRKFVKLGKLNKIAIFSYASEFLKQKRVAERQAEAAIKSLSDFLLRQASFRSAFGFDLSVMSSTPRLPSTSSGHELVECRLEESSRPNGAQGRRRGRLFYKGRELIVSKTIEYFPTLSTGSSLDLVAYFEKNAIIGANALGKIGKKAERVGEEAAKNLIFEINSKAYFDSHSADQILPYFTFLGQEIDFSVSKVTQHLQTNIWVIKKFLPGEFEIKGNLIKFKK